MRLFDCFRGFQRSKELLETAKQIDPSEAKNYIIANGLKHDIDWDKVVIYTQPEALELPSYCYKTVKSERKPTMFMAHWDVCLSSKSCYKILIKRKLSVHFLIDNDGTIYQIMDTNHIAWHAGRRKVNNTSIGVEISNAYYPKYQSLYVKNGFGERPVWDNSKVHDKVLEPHLGFYPVQEKAFAALAKCLNKVYNIPLEVPKVNNQLVKTIYKDAKEAKYKGVVNHYHITERKIDCAGFKIDKVIKDG